MIGDGTSEMTLILFVGTLVTSVMIGASVGYYDAVVSVEESGWDYACIRSMWTTPEYCLGTMETE